MGKVGLCTRGGKVEHFHQYAQISGRDLTCRCDHEELTFKFYYARFIDLVLHKVKKTAY